MGHSSSSQSRGYRGETIGGTAGERTRGPMDERTQPGTSHTVDWDGPVHYVDFGGDPEGPTVVLVHGLGGAHLHWDLLAPLLTPHGRVLALDLPGLGRSGPGSRRATVQAHAAVLRRVLPEGARGPGAPWGD